jgi:dGTP triphosphohydrolase
MKEDESSKPHSLESSFLTRQKNASQKRYLARAITDFAPIAPATDKYAATV